MSLLTGTFQVNELLAAYNAERQRAEKAEADLLSQAQVNKVLSDEVLIYMKERDAYAKAMKVALENGIYANKAQVKAEIEALLSERDAEGEGSEKTRPKT